MKCSNGIISVTKEGYFISEYQQDFRLLVFRGVSASRVVRMTTYLRARKPVCPPRICSYSSSEHHNSGRLSTAISGAIHECLASIVVTSTIHITIRRWLNSWLSKSLRLHCGPIGRFLSIKADINVLHAGRRPAAVHTDGHVVTVQSGKIHMVRPN